MNRSRFLVSAEEIKQSLVDNYVTYVKYVRVKPNEYRFAFAAEITTPRHKDMLDEGEAVISAGVFKLYRNNRFEWEQLCSQSLLIPAADDDEKNLKGIFFGGGDDPSQH